MKTLPILDIPILLASASPRRKHLLQEAGFQIRIVHPDIEETYPEDLPPDQVPLFIAQKKALAVIKAHQPGEVVLAADSVVILEDMVLGKPESNDHAVEMLESLAGRMHLVVTGVTLMDPERTSSFSSTSEVYFHPMNTDEIRYYVNHYRPYDKAGSYGIQEWIGWCKIKEIRGSYSNIMGLPVAQVYERMEAFYKNDAS